jgi:Glycosyl hydrolase catalytic core
MMRIRSALLVLIMVASTVVFGGELGSAASPRLRAKLVHSKRGIASSRYLETDPGALSGLGATWAYDWSTQPPPPDRRLEWVPMVRGSRSVTPTVLGSLRAAARAGRARYLLGFNEPDSSSQADMTPGEAARLWPELERTGLKLGSPAPQVAGDGWLARFMALAKPRHLEVDFIALHYYQDFTNPRAVQTLRRQLTQIHDAYRKPIWITEIGAIDIRRWGEPMMLAPTEAAADIYMRHLFAMLDSLPFVQRYAWFTDDCCNQPDCHYGSLFTGLGQLAAAGHTFEAAP